MTKLSIQVSPNKDGETIIREGLALPLEHPKPVNITGTLSAPADWLAQKKPDPVTSHLLIKNSSEELVLIIGEREPTQVCITGELKRDAALGEFGINTPTRWKPAVFRTFIRTMRYYFADKEQHAAIVASLQKWSAEITRVIDDHNDNKGNTKQLLETKVGKVELIQKFTLEIPIYQGYAPVKFSVDIGLEVKTMDVELFLYSDELIELTEVTRRKIFAEELERMKDFLCSKLVID